MYPEIFVTTLFIFLAPYVLFFSYAKYYGKKPWKFRVDGDFQPNVSILVPAHNEEAVIIKKLENLSTVSYPQQKIEIIVVDDASEDKTLLKAENFRVQHPELNIKIVRQDTRVGKSPALNAALPSATHGIVIVSDAETFWPPDILLKALPYLADPKVGAITGRGLNKNSNHSWVSNSEDKYLDVVRLIKIGESKMHSTIRFEGGFCAFKKGTFKEFDQETGADDSGTALNVILNNYLAIGVPEAVFYTSIPTTFNARLKIKVRRANHLVSLWLKCAKLLLKGRLPLAKRIAIPEIMLLTINPVLFTVLVITAAVGIILSPFSLFSIFLLLAVGGFLLLLRRAFLEVLIANGVLFYALINVLLGRHYISWEKPKS